MNEIYCKLNYYLNDICNYLEKGNGFLLENIHAISRLNDAFLGYMQSYNLDNETKQNKLQFIYSILYNPCIFKAYRLLNVQT